MQIFFFHNQRIEYEHSTHTAFTIIDEPYGAAGRDLGWSENTAGIGLNENIISFVLQHKATLIVRIGVSGFDYWISPDKLLEFLKNNFCDKKQRGINLKVISIKKFIRLTHHNEL